MEKRKIKIWTERNNKFVFVFLALIKKSELGGSWATPANVFK